MQKQQYYLSPEQFDELKSRELEYINRHRYGLKRGSENTEFITGLALSGGGIRSAIFNLGVLQALAKTGFLEKIDYLSTVSGGGYIGSSLTWFLSSETQQEFASNATDLKTEANQKAVFGTQKNNFPYGTDEPGQLVTGANSSLQNTLLEYLRNRGNFLTPGDNYTLLTLIAVALRTGMLSLMTWVPLIALIMLVIMLPDLYFDCLQKNNIPVIYKAIGVLGLLSGLAFIVAGTLMAGIISFNTNKGKDDENFRFRLLADKLSNGLLISIIVCLSIYFIAWLGTKVISSGNIVNQTTYLLSVALMLIGIVAGLITLFKPDSQLMNKVLLPLAASLLAFGILFCAYQLAYAAALQHQSTVFGLILRWDYFLGSGVVIALFLCARTNLNDISIARFYRDRLKETFMPDSKSIRPGTSQNLSKEAYLKDMCQSTEDSHYQGPYHIINANVILVESKQKKYSRRGGDNFILSPLYCGSKATGWRQTSHYFKGEMTLATAMAISGAAVNPNSGAGGRGVTRNKVVSFVLSILNLRMGLWCPNPDPSIESLASFYAGNFLQSAWYSIKSWIAKRGYHEHAACIRYLMADISKT